MHISKQKVECDKCKRLISRCNHNKHFLACGTHRLRLFSTDGWFTGLMWKCPSCEIETKTRQSISSHYWRLHTEDGKNIQYNPATLENGKHISWNKGLSKETDERILHNSIAVSLATKGRPGREHTDESKRKISLARSANNKGGRCKWFEVASQKVQGTWEQNVALKFEELGIQWLKLKTNQHTFEYEMDNKIRSYTPDFYLPDYNVYLELKGRWWGRDKEKMDLVLEKYKDKKIVVIEKDNYEKLLRGELVW